MKLNKRFSLLFVMLIYIGIKQVNAQVGPSRGDRTIEVNNFLKKLTDIVKNNSAFTQSLNWKKVDSELARRADTMTSLSSARELATYMISQLKAAGDKHSFLMNKTVTKSYAEGIFVLNEPQVKLISENIGMISIPALHTSNTQIHKEFATTIQDMIRRLDSAHNIKGWIVDLRSNTGGSMYPMIVGVGPLLGSGKLGYFVRHTNKKMLYTPWYYNKGASGIEKGVFTRVDRPYKLKNGRAKVAVLIGKLTSSAGEMTAISFSGAKNVRFFGQPSGGYTTGNESFDLPDGSKLYLAMVYSANRNKKIFNGQLIPDDFVESGKDNAEIEAAKSWLLGI